MTFGADAGPLLVTRSREVRFWPTSIPALAVFVSERSALRSTAVAALASLFA
jgi:hypothetical protein